MIVVAPAPLARAGLVSLLLFSAACRDEAPPPVVPSPSPSPTTASAAPSLGAGTTTTATVAGERDDDRAARCVAWAGLPRCRLGDRVVASAHVRGVQNGSLARAAAQNRARSALLGEGAGSVEGASVLRYHSCDGVIWALAIGRVEGSEALPECDAAAFDGALPAP